MKNFLLLVAGIFVAVALAEAAVRIIEAAGNNKEISYSNLYRDSVIQLNALNYNEMPVPRAKPPGSFRVLSFGDSFAYSIVKAPRHYHGIAASLASEISKRPVQIVNLGEPAVSFYQYMNAYEVWGKLFEYDGVIFNVYLGNDVLDVAYKYVPNDVKIHRLFLPLDVDLATGRPRSVALPRKFPLRLLDYAYANYLLYTRAVEPTSAMPSSPYNFAVVKLNEDVWLDILNTQLDNFDAAKIEKLREGYLAAIKFARFAAKVGDNGKRVVVLLSPNESQVNDRVLDQVVQKFKRDLSHLDLDLNAYIIQRIFQEVAKEIPVIYLRSILRCAEQSGVSTYYGTDTHWSVDGNSVVGRYLGRWVATNWLGTADLSDRSDGRDHGSCSQGMSEEPQRDSLFTSRIKPLIDSVARSPKSRLSENVESPSADLGTTASNYGH